MSPDFIMNYQLRTHALSVIHNGAEQLTNSFSPFARFSGRPFAQWYTELPQACFEVAGTKRYTVRFTGETLLADILECVLSGQLIRASPPASPITTRHRLAWAKELGAATGMPLRLNALHVRRTATASPSCAAVTLSDGTPVRLISTDSDDDADVFLMDAAEAFDHLAQQVSRRDRLRLFVCPGGEDWQVLQTAPGCCLARCPEPLLPQQLRRWYETFFLPAQLAAYQAALRGRSMSSLLREKLLRLTEDKPYLHMTLPSRVKVGDAFELPKVTKLPEDMAADILPDMRCVNVEKRGGQYWVIPRREGRFSFVVEPKAFPAERVAFSTEAYQLHPVTDIRLSASNLQLLPGESFTVSAAYTPSHADNVSRARWTVASGASHVRMDAPGRVTALSAGQCVITHEVEGVRASVTIDVLPMATGLKLSEHRMTVKVNDGSKRLSVTVVPGNAQGYNITYSVKDPSVLKVDPLNGQIIPVDEGQTTIDICLMNRGGQFIQSDSCSVEVVPVHPVVNPDAATFCAIVLLLLQGLFSPLPLATFLMPGVVVAALIGMLRNRILLVRGINLAFMLLSLFIQFH